MYFKKPQRLTNSNSLPLLQASTVHPEFKQILPIYYLNSYFSSSFLLKIFCFQSHFATSSKFTTSSNSFHCVYINLQFQKLAQDLTSKHFISTKECEYTPTAVYSLLTQTFICTFNKMFPLGCLKYNISLSDSTTQIWLYNHTNLLVSDFQMNIIDLILLRLFVILILFTPTVEMQPRQLRQREKTHVSAMLKCVVNM